MPIVLSPAAAAALARSTVELLRDTEELYPPRLNPTAFTRITTGEFHPELYIGDLRSFLPLETLRSQLQSQLTFLQRELLDLINRDYLDFASLNTTLIDIDARVVRMRAPLLDIKEKILKFRRTIDAALVALQSRLKQRASADQTREVLDLLLNSFHAVSKVEKLMEELRAVPIELANSVSVDGFPREAQSMLLERIISEMNRLNLIVAHAQNMPFIENMEKRMQSASLLVDTSLEHCFTDALERKDVNAMYSCLRAFAASDNAAKAEEIVRSTLVAPLMEKVFNSDWKSDDLLEQDYERIKQYIDDDCRFFLEISCKENSGLHVFSFMANSILKEVLSAIRKVKPGVFSLGRPTEFLMNYKASLDFIAHLEAYYHTKSAVAEFRDEAVYVEFMKQWNVGAYFSVRFQRIAETLDESLKADSLVPVPTSFSDSQNSKELVLKQSASLLECLRSCWPDDDVFVVSLSDKFLRFTLQLLSRYSHWLSTGLAAQKSGKIESNSGFAVPKDLICVMHDLHHLIEEVSGSYLEHVTKLHKSCPAEVLDLVKEGILQGCKLLLNLEPLVMDSIIDTLVKKSVEDLKQLHGMAATYHYKPLPVMHSPYVFSVLRPLKAFLDTERVAKVLTAEAMNCLLQRMASEITCRYHEQATKIVSDSRRRDSSLQNMRKGAQWRAGNGTGAGTSSDVSEKNTSEKICMQLFLDIQEYGRNLASLGIQASSIPEFRSLWEAVAPQDRRNYKSF